MIYTELIKKAALISFDAHKDDLDKGGYPYFMHPLHLAEHFNDETCICVALLHDVVEDHGDKYSFEYLEQIFPQSIIKPLRLLTHKDGVPYEEYIGNILSSNVATKVKIQDLEHNTTIERNNGIKPTKYSIYLAALELLKKSDSFTFLNEKQKKFFYKQYLRFAHYHNISENLKFNGLDPFINTEEAVLLLVTLRCDAEENGLFEYKYKSLRLHCSEKRIKKEPELIMKEANARPCPIDFLAACLIYIIEECIYTTIKKDGTKGYVCEYAYNDVIFKYLEAIVEKLGYPLEKNPAPEPFKYVYYGVFANRKIDGKVTEVLSDFYRTENVLNNIEFYYSSNENNEPSWHIHGRFDPFDADIADKLSDVEAEAIRKLIEAKCENITKDMIKEELLK